MGDLTWTGWGHLNRLVVVRTSGPLAGTAPSTLTFNWKDTWRASVGVNYKPNDTWKIRFGVAYDETPTNDVDRTPRVPDENRTWLAIGAQMKLFKTGMLDVGYAHEFIKDSTVNNAAPLGGRLIGRFNNKADILSVQYSHSF
jgi:long-chain fatty acid transport protein